MLQINNTTSIKKSKINMSKIDFGSILISIMIIVVMLFILFDPVTYSKSIINGLSLYFFNVLPGLLPFMFFIKQLTNQNFIVKIIKPFKNVSKKL